tara:strand:- start:4322 stop:5575 length:1254 start_codon:yes stop_codon:yes gene_type:complete
MSEFLKTSLEYVLHKPISGSRPKGGASIVGEIPSLGGENITMEGGLKLEVVKKISSEFFKSMPRGQLRNLDVLINKDGANTGKSTIYRKSPFLNAAVNEHLFILRGKEGKLDQEYLHHLLQFSLIKAILEIKITGSAQPGINSTFVKNFPVDLAPFPEQKKIASILTSVEEVIENTKKQIDKLRDLKKATMNVLLTKGIGHTEFKDSELGRIPKSWEVKTLSTICKKIADRDHTTPEYVHKSDGVPIVSPTNLDADMELDLTKLKYVSFEAHEKNQKKTDLSPNDIIFSRIGAGLGKSYLVKSSFYNFSILHSLCQIRADKNLISPTYLLWQMRTREFQDRLWLGVQSIGVPDLGLGEIGHLKVPVCSLDEQQRITRHLESVQSCILQKKSLLKKNQSLKKSLMQDLLTGKVRVRVN